MLSQETGEYVHGEFHATSSTGGEITLYDVNGNARTLGSEERLVITDATAIFSAAGEGGIYFDADNDNVLDAGEAVVRGSFTENGGVSVHFTGIPRWGAKGALPHVVGPSGTIDAIITGFIF
jgi:hypothetical protein